MNTSVEPEFSRGLFWFRRDLRLDDNTGLAEALARCAQVHLVFVFDTTILNGLPQQDRRVEFILQSLQALDEQVRHRSQNPATGLITLHGVADHEIPALAQKLGVQVVFTNHDDEPHALARDAHVRTRLAQQGQGFFTFKDHVVFERREILTQSGGVYGVFTPYKNAWLKRVDDHALADRGGLTQNKSVHLAERPPEWHRPLPSLASLGFEPTQLNALGIQGGAEAAQRLLADFLPRIGAYDRARDFPAIKGPSYLSVHLRFGTISIRALARAAHKALPDPGAATWLSELIWRDFYAQILANHPQVVNKSYKPEYDAIQWEQGPAAESQFEAWCQGRTGYPLVDAAMAQLNRTGYMHNRLRMVVASFLVKDLGIDWRWGEAYFAKHLNDFDLSANNGGWQWASSSGCDAQPYFRIFNPISQSEKFDPRGQFIRRYLPELAGLSDKSIHAPWLATPLELQAAGLGLGGSGEGQYPLPVVDHAQARERTLARYAVVKTSKSEATG
jgi:deoxyribodipyrimidine photo-lyase